MPLVVILIALCVRVLLGTKLLHVHSLGKTKSQKQHRNEEFYGNNTADYF